MRGGGEKNRVREGKIERERERVYYYTKLHVHLQVQQSPPVGKLRTQYLSTCLQTWAVSCYRLFVSSNISQNRNHTPVKTIAQPNFGMPNEKSNNSIIPHTCVQYMLLCILPTEI